jgi:hypothetical protein
MHGVLPGLVGGYVTHLQQGGNIDHAKSDLLPALLPESVAAQLLAHCMKCTPFLMLERPAAE